MAKKSLTWLHLSDIHLGSPSEAHWRAKALNALLATIERESQGTWRPDLVFFTGDLGFSAKSHEYFPGGSTDDYYAQLFFDQVLEKAGLGGLKNERLFIVPGNHDVDRDVARNIVLPDGRTHDDWITIFVNSEGPSYLGVSDNFFGDPALLNTVLQKFKEFQSFLYSYLGRRFSEDKPYLVVVCEIRGVSIGIMGFNTAWLAGDNEKTYSQLLGLLPLELAIKELSESKVDLTFAVFHHPCDELNQYERYMVRHRLTLTTDFVLCGHLDNPDLPNPQSAKSKRVPFIQVGPTYGGPRFPNRFYFARCDIEHNEGWITFNPFRYSDTNFSWLPDVEVMELIKQRHDSEILKLWPIVEPRRWTPHPIIKAPAGFEGRREQLLKLDEWYESSVPLAAVIGLSGVGKTWLVRKWLAQKADANSGFTYQTAEASTLFLSEDDNPDKFAAQVLERVSELYEVEPMSVLEMPLEELASKARASKQVLVVDHAECLCHKRGAKRDVGRLAVKFQDFLTAFVKIPLGPGRMILLSNLRPSGLVEKELIDRNCVAVIGSERDPWQMMGLPEEEAVPFLSKLLGPDHEFNHEALVKVVQRFGGHPMALRWFSMVSSEDQERILKKELPAGLPFVELHGLLGSVVRNCSVEEVDLLKIVCVLRQAEQTDFFGTIRPALNLQAIHECLDILRRRCLVEYGLVPRTGFNAHSIVKEWASQAYATELTELHRLVASEYSNRDDSLPAAYHFEKAGDHRQAKEWRNQYTRRNLKEGRQAYFDGDFARAREHSTEFIEEIRQMPTTAASHRYLSYAYLNRAVSQHKESFDWEAERDDLRKALEEWEDNERALTFYVAVLGEALRQRRPWRDIDAELEHVVPLAEKVGNKSGADSLAMVALLGLLCFGGQHTPDSTCRGIICEKLAHAIDIHLDTAKRKLLEEEAFKAWIQALTFLAHARDGDGRMRYIDAAVDLADKATIISHSAELLLIRATAYHLMASFASDASERLDWLKKTEDVLTSIRDSVALPSGFARLFSIAILDSASLKGRNEAIRQIEKAMEELRALRVRTLSTTYRDSEFDSAEVRLRLQAAELAPENREKHLLPALSIVREALTTGTRLTPELADCAIQAFIEGAQESISAGAPPEDETQETVSLPETMRVSRIEMREIDKAIQAAERAMPSPRFAMLRLRLRVQYLRVNWTIGDPNEPKVTQEAIERAKRLSTQFENDPFVWLESVELWKIVAQRTFSESRFGQAVQEANATFPRLSSCATRSKYLLREAAFLRAIMDYGGVRRVLRTYLADAKSAHVRFAACNLLLDAVAHSIHWSVRDEPSLLEDAKAASELYEEYLIYLGIKQEDESDRRAARRVLCWLRCASFAGLTDVPDLSWVNDIYQYVRFSGGAVTNVQILGSLSSSPSRLARILGNHLLDGTMWREIATYLSTQFGQDPKHQEEAIRFWHISKWWLENALRWEGKQRGKVSVALADLNLARALLRHPMGSATWHEGATRLKELYSQQMPWVYKRFVVQLWEQIQKSFGSSS
jgi:hypothetical protein